MDSGPQKKADDPVVAVVGDELIRLSEVGDEIRSMPGGGDGNAFETLYPVARNRVIERTALVLKAQADGVAADPVVQRQMREVANKVLVDAYLHHATAQMVTDQMLTARYDAEIRGKPGPEEVHGQAILVPTEAEARDIIARLAAGADFDALSERPSSMAKSKMGGDLGFVRRDQVAPQVGSVLFALRPGEVAPYPVRAPVGWFVLRTVARRFAPTPSFSEVRSRLEAECEVANVAAVARAALSGITVKAYDMNGH